MSVGGLLALARRLKALGMICFFFDLWYMFSLNCWKNWKAQTSLKLSLIIKDVDVIDNCYKMSMITKWSVWIIIFALNNSIIYLTFFTTYTKPVISSFVSQ